MDRNRGTIYLKRWLTPVRLRSFQPLYNNLYRKADCPKRGFTLPLLLPIPLS